jgi:ankyrin repeat protein
MLLLLAFRKLDALQIAALNIDLGMLSALVDAGARADPSPDQKYRLTAFQLAVQVNKAEIAKELLRLGAEVNMVGYGQYQQNGSQKRSGKS